MIVRGFPVLFKGKRCDELKEQDQQQCDDDYCSY
jgi:hypothetical protein